MSERDTVQVPSHLKYTLFDNVDAIGDENKHVPQIGKMSIPGVLFPAISLGDYNSWITKGTRLGCVTS